MLEMLLLGLLLAAFVYFGLSYVTARTSFKKATKIQRWNAAIEEAKEQEDRGRPRDNLRRYLRLRGWHGSIMPLVLGAMLIYAACVLVLGFLGMHGIIGALASALVAWSLVVGLNRRIYVKRRDRFRRQLMQLISMMASQIQDIGTGPQRALAQIVPQLEDPLGMEMAEVLAQVTATRDLIGALGELESRYPSRAFTMFIATLEMSESVGGVGIADALRRVAQILNRDFELTEEANAEISQTRAEFYVVTAIISFICFIMFEKSGSANRVAYESVAGVIFVGLGIANYLLGIFRVRKVLSKARGSD